MLSAQTVKVRLRQYLFCEPVGVGCREDAMLNQVFPVPKDELEILVRRWNEERLVAVTGASLEQPVQPLVFIGLDDQVVQKTRRRPGLTFRPDADDGDACGSQLTYRVKARGR
jgi:hypothetical protein